jgi:hypothetical protein
MKSIDSASTTGAMFPAMGFWISVLLAILNAVYLGVLGFLMFSGSAYPPPESSQPVIHILVLICVPLLILLWTQLHDAAPLDRKFFSHSSLAFLIIFAALTSINRFVALTVVPQSLAAGSAAGLQWFLPYEWPSVMLAIEMLGWGFFFGLACLTLAPVFLEGGLERALCWTLIVTAVFNFFTIVALVIDQFALIGLAAPIAWGIGPILAFILMAIWFRRQM